MDYNWYSLHITLSTLFLISLSGINKTIESIGKENCTKITSPTGDLSYCEDIILINGIAYASCDPSREKINKVLDYNYYEPNEAIPPGNIWQIDYTTSPPKLTVLTKDLKLDNFHPIGISADDEQGVFLAINLPIEPGSTVPTIEVFSIQNKNNNNNNNDNDNEPILIHKKTLQHEHIYNPNALHLVKDPQWYSADGSTPSFFFSNDHYYQHKVLKLVENTAILPISNVMFYDARHDQVVPVLQDLAFANGVSGNDSLLFVAETNKLRVKQYKLTLDPLTTDPKEMVQLQFIQKINVNMAVDNLDYVPSKNQLVIAGHPKGLDFINFAFAKDRSDPNLVRASSLVSLWDLSSSSSSSTKENKPNLKTLFSDDGYYYAASSTGALDSHHQKLVISSLYDNGILVCDM
ncbi:unnamed protein product [Cunninghamella echinulata]